MILDYTKTNADMHDQYTWETLNTLKWMGDDKMRLFFEE